MSTSTPRILSLPKQLLVEGKDAWHFFSELVKYLGLSDIEIQDFAGINQLSGYLKQIVRNPGFKTVPVTSMAIIRDAEDCVESAFQSVCGALRNAGLPAPMNTAKPISGEIRVGIFILPDNENPGMIETLLLHAINDDPAIPCVDAYLQCLLDKCGIIPRPRDKARLLAYLASRPDIKPLTGHAARSGYLQLDSKAYEPLKHFLHNI